MRIIALLNTALMVILRITVQNRLAEIRLNNILRGV